MLEAREKYFQLYLLSLKPVSVKRARANSVYADTLCELWSRAELSPLQRRNRPRLSRWSLTPPPRLSPREGCRRPQNGMTASSLGWPSVRRWRWADWPHPGAQQLWFCLYWSPEKSFREKPIINILFVFSLCCSDCVLFASCSIFTFYNLIVNCSVLEMWCDDLVSPGRWLVWLSLCGSGLQ